MNKSYWVLLICAALLFASAIIVACGGDDDDDDDNGCTTCCLCQCETDCQMQDFLRFYEDNRCLDCNTECNSICQQNDCPSGVGQGSDACYGGNDSDDDYDQ